VKTLEPVSSEPLGFAGEDTTVTTPFFDVRQTVYSQYANSPTILALLDSFSGAIDRQGDVNDFFEMVWDVNTANSYGLDVWGRIVGIGRALYVSEGTFLGFTEATDAKAFDEGIFYGGAKLTANYQLTDEAYRRVIIAKAAANITDGSISSLNAILMTIFPNYGNCYVRDNQDMTMTLVFGAALSKVDYAIIGQSGVLPRPVGVSFTVEQP
jgi:hypothetical protein